MDLKTVHQSVHLSCGELKYFVDQLKHNPITDEDYRNLVQIWMSLHELDTALFNECYK